MGGVADHRHEQPVLDRHRQPDVDLGQDGDPRLGDLGVEARVGNQRPSCRSDDVVGDRRRGLAGRLARRPIGEHRVMSASIVSVSWAISCSDACMRLAIVPRIPLSRIVSTGSCSNAAYVGDALRRELAGAGRARERRRRRG